jgi:hypothetical protein
MGTGQRKSISKREKRNLAAIGPHSPLDKPN